MITKLVNSNIYFLNYYCSHMFFNLASKKLNKIFKKNMASNFTSLIHAVGCVLLAGNYLLNKKNQSFNVLKIFSSGYFIYDLLYLIKHWEPKTINYAYLYHHTASLYLMHENPKIYKTVHLFFFAELSNIPGYFVYYFKKQKNCDNIVKKLKYLQFFMYSIIRVPIVGKILYDGYVSAEKEGNYLPFLIGSPVFLMGLIWSKKLFDKL